MNDSIQTSISPVLHSVGWGGKYVSMPADVILGVGRMRNVPRRGFRLAVWDVAFGYVSGFRKRDILWYVIQCSFSSRLAKRHSRRAAERYAKDGVMGDPLVLPVLVKGRTPMSLQIEFFIDKRIQEGFDMHALVDSAEAKMRAAGWRPTVKRMQG